MAGTFAARMEELEQMVGDGDLVGEVIFDQVYARYQHEGIEFKHPKGGQAKFLESALKEKYVRYFEELAGSVTEGDLRQTMIEVAEDLAGESARRAPVEEGTLRASASPRVYEDGKLVYVRPGAPRIED